MTSDPASSVTAAAEAILQADDHSDTAWRDAAFDAVQKLADSKPLFIVDEVWPLIPVGITTHENRAIGAVMRRAAKEKLIEPMFIFRTSGVPTHHANPRRVWRSLIYRGETL